MIYPYIVRVTYEYSLLCKGISLKIKQLSISNFNFPDVHVKIDKIYI